MKLLALHIENFGKLSNCNYTFQDGINVICEDNGFGKTTLGAFIKVMFFGFENEGKKKDFIERNAYLPWQSGVYGGFIDFEVNHRQYRLTKRFGEKKNDTKGSLIDLSTNKESHDFDIDNIGKRILEIDGSSFSRTAFISQNNYAMDVISDIDAKLGDLSKTSDDMGSYSKADVLLKNTINALKPNTKKGKIKVLNDEIHELEYACAQRVNVENTIDDLESKIQTYHKEIRDNITTIKTLEDKSKSIASIKDRLALKEKYQGLIEQENHEKLKMDEEKIYFNNHLPDISLLNQYYKESKKLAVYLDHIEKNQLSSDQEKQLQKYHEQFKDKNLDHYDYDALTNEISVLSNMKSELEESRMSKKENEDYLLLTRSFKDSQYTFNDLQQLKEQWDTIVETVNPDIKEKTYLLNSYKTSQSQMMISPFVYLGLIIMFAGIVLAFMVHRTAGIMIAVLGAFMMILGFIAGRNASRKKMQKTIDQLQQQILNEKQYVAMTRTRIQDALTSHGYVFNEYDISKKITDLLNDYRRYLELHQLSQSISLDKVQAYKQRVKALQEVMEYYGYTGDDLSIVLTRMDNDIRIYQQLSTQYHNYLDYEKNYNELYKKLSDYILLYMTNVEEDINDQLEKMKDHLDDYMQYKDEFNKAYHKVDEFEKSHPDYFELLDLEDSYDQDELTKLSDSIQKLYDGNEDIQKMSNQTQEQLDRLSEQLNDILSKEEQVKLKREELETTKTKYQQLVVTQELLGKAKDSFNQKYAGPIVNALRKYYSLLTGEDASNVNIDTDKNVYVTVYGEMHKQEYLSTGYKDLTDLCLRLSLVDAMYPEEKPMLIFDDPFINLDEDKIHRGLKLIKEVSKEYQILYFTCHKDRTL